jgi:hypothetical protein
MLSVKNKNTKCFLQKAILLFIGLIPHKIISIFLFSAELIQFIGK